MGTQSNNAKKHKANDARDVTEVSESSLVFYAQLLSTHLAESNKQQLRLNKLTNRILLVLAVTMLAAVISAAAMLATFLWGEGILRP